MLWRWQWYLLPWTVVRIKECALCLWEMLSLENIQSPDSRVLFRASLLVTVVCNTNSLHINDDWLPTDIRYTVNNFSPWVWDTPTVWRMGTYVHERVLKVVYWWPLAAEGDWWQSGFYSYSLLLSPILVSPASGWLQNPGLFPPICYGLLALLNGASLFWFPALIANFKSTIFFAFCVTPNSLEK